MMNRSSRPLATLALLAAVLSPLACTSKGAPSPQGTLLTSEQIASLSKTGAFDGKLVMMEGYAAFCGGGLFTHIKAGEKSTFTLTSKPHCQGAKLAQMDILYAGTTIPLSGEKERNYFNPGAKRDSSTLKFMTDDYQEVQGAADVKLKFSGTLASRGTSAYVLENATIHR